MGSTLCEVCSRVTTESLTTTLQEIPDWWSEVCARPQPKGMIHQRKSRDLLDSATTCSLCSLILHSLSCAIQKNGGKTEIHSEASNRPQFTSSESARQLAHQLGDQPVYLAPKQDDVRTMWPEGCDRGAELRGILVHVSMKDSKVLSGILRMWARPGSPAQLSGDVAGRPRLSNSGTHESHALITKWLHACEEQHRDCKILLSGICANEEEDEILPTRVVDVGQHAQNNLHLLDTNGTRGSYVALSHCWGPPSRAPLRTTLPLLNIFRQEIPWDELPKTFKDAITVTRAIGMRYLWIDSLCIVQDDLEDWKREAQKMGTVYERARITLAASHATSSHDGLFLDRPPLPDPVELPYRDETGQEAGSFFVVEDFNDFHAISPENGPLNMRAWATQEWLLSRRMVFYTAESMMWSCKTITQRETGARCRNIGRNPRWKTVVEQYSARQLTEPGDKLIALEGLKNTLATRLNDEYVSGIWRQCLPDQLLWRVRVTRQKRANPLQLPSWTWASTEVAVRFLDIKGAKNNCAGFDFQDNKLFIRSRLRKVRPPNSVARGTQISASTSPLALSSQVNLIMSEARKIPTDLVKLLNDDVGNPLGWMVLDEPNLPSSSIVCLLLMSRIDRKSRDSILWDRPANPLKKYEDWVLILQQHENQTDSYVRIGVGKVYNPNWWDETQITRICIL